MPCYLLLTLFFVVAITERTALEDFPFFVLLMDKLQGKVQCVGSLINSKIVVTNGLCAYHLSSPRSGFKLEIRSLNGRYTTKAERISESCHFKRHRNFTFYINNVGLARVKKNAPYVFYSGSKKIRVIYDQYRYEKWSSETIHEQSTCTTLKLKKHSQEQPGLGSIDAERVSLKVKINPYGNCVSIYETLSNNTVAVDDFISTGLFCVSARHMCGIEIGAPLLCEETLLGVKTEDEFPCKDDNETDFALFARVDRVLEDVVEIQLTVSGQPGSDCSFLKGIFMAGILLSKKLVAG